MTGFAFDAQLHDIFSAILHQNFLTYDSMPSKFLHNLTKNLPRICTPIIMRCSLKKYVEQAAVSRNGSECRQNYGIKPEF